MIIALPWKSQNWSCPIGSVPVAFNGAHVVLTRVQVDAPGNSSRKQQQSSPVSHEQFLTPLRNLVAHF